MYVCAINVLELYIFGHLQTSTPKKIFCNSLKKWCLIRLLHVCGVCTCMYAYYVCIGYSIAASATHYAITFLQSGAACPSSLSSLTMGEIDLLVSQTPAILT